MLMFLFALAFSLMGFALLILFSFSVAIVILYGIIVISGFLISFALILPKLFVLGVKNLINKVKENVKIRKIEKDPFD